MTALTIVAPRAREDPVGRVMRGASGARTGHDPVTRGRSAPAREGLNRTGVAR